jgi:putative MATE family efflux protein
LSTIPSYRRIWKLSYPIILSLLAQNIIAVTDTAFLGRVGEVELGASAIGGLFYYVLFMIGFGFGTGAQILIGRRNGEKQYSEIGRIFDQTLYLFLGIGFILLFAIFFGGPLFFKTFVSSPKIYEASVTFINYRVWGIFFAFFNVAFRAFYVGITSTRLLTYSAIIMAVANIFLDYAMIFGHFGFPEMGIAGAALASSISEGIAATFFFIATFSNNKLKPFQLFQFPKFDKDIIVKSWNLSVFIMLQNFVSLAAWFAFFLIIEQIGERPLAISNIMRSIYMLLMLHIWAFSATTSTLVSNTLGEGHSKNLPAIIGRVNKISTLITLLIMGIALLIPEVLIRIYTNVPNLIVSSREVFYVVILALLPLALAVNWFSGIAGTGNTKIALMVEVVAITLYLVYVYYITFVVKASLSAIWTSEFIYSLLLGILSWLYIKSGRWEKTKV